SGFALEAGQADFDHLGVRMPSGVGERFLDHPVDDHLELWIEADRSPRPVLDGGPDVDPIRRSYSLGERDQRGVEPELVERRWPQLGYENPQAVYLGVELLERALRHAPEQLLVPAAVGGGQQHTESAESLEGLVMQLARPPTTLVLGRSETL